MSKGRIAFVTPRYGDAVVGGSEAVVREAAHGLAERDYEVEVLTTCALDHYTWANEFEPGSFLDGSVTVRRFATIQARDRGRWTWIQERLLSGDHLDEAEELAWINGRFRVPDLYLYLAAHAEQYAAVVFSPYLFWSTLYCTGIAPERSVLMPCLHDEPYAYLRSVAAALASCAGVLVPVRARAPAGSPAGACVRPSLGDRGCGERPGELRPRRLPQEARA